MEQGEETYPMLSKEDLDMFKELIFFVSSCWSQEVLENFLNSVEESLKTSKTKGIDSDSVEHRRKEVQATSERNRIC